MVSVIIPVYNEEKSIADCLSSLAKQSEKSLEIVLVDDGSTDKSKKVLSQIPNPKSQIRILSQPHQGPGIARNLGAKEARGNILVFADADMTFDTNFVRDLVEPIKRNESVGTFSKEEFLKNGNNPWALCWNINRFFINGWIFSDEMKYRILPSFYPNEQPVFRSITKAEFLKVGGFDDTGYTDDWTLSKKLGVLAKAVSGAKYYHRNPDNLSEVFQQAKWIGRNEFLTCNVFRRIYNLIRYSLPISIVIGIYVSMRLIKPRFVIFKIIYDLGIWLSVLLSFISKTRIK